MLQKNMVFLGTWMLLLSASTFCFFSFPTASVVKRYQNLQKKEEIASSTQAIASTHQIREGVRKEIWVSQEDGSRLQYRIASATSTLSILPGEKRVQIMENLHNIHCLMQDKLYTAQGHPEQQVRLLEAKEGVYDYQAHAFQAQTVELSLLRLPGKTLPPSCTSQNAFLSGVAKDVSFSFGEKAPKFHAQQFKALFKEGTP